MYEITVTMEFCAAHRLMGHEGKCATLHGHNYTVDVVIASNILDPIGRVVDAAEVKRCIGGWINENLDHCTMLQDGDPLIEHLEQLKLPCWKMVQNPTAENIGDEILHWTAKAFDDEHRHCKVVAVFVRETGRLSATSYRISGIEKRHDG